MQNEQKPMKQSRNIDQKPNFGPNLGLNGPNFGPQFIFDDWNHKYQLEIIIAYHYVQNTKNLTSKSREIEFGDINKSQDHSIMSFHDLLSQEPDFSWTCGFRESLKCVMFFHFQQ